jgi:hypothetical protein
MEQKKLKELVASLAAMEVSLLRLIRGETNKTEDVLRVYAEQREKLGYPISDNDFARLLHMAEQADADDFGKT